MAGLQLDWQLWLSEIKDKQIQSIYFGGGTPSLLGPERTFQLLEWIRRSGAVLASDLEVTLEANPEHVTLQLMQHYFQAGINRVSMGIQSFDDSLLSILSRTHKANKAIDAIENTVASGLTNLSIDLMYDLPTQQLDSWRDTVKRASELPITHLSLYNLTFEPYTSFYKHRERLTALLPDPDLSLAMYETAVEIFEKSGLKQYEISAFAKEGFQSKHNTGYWLGRPFLGFGPSAFSYWNGKRFCQIANLNRYVELLEAGKSTVDFEEELMGEAKRRELFAVQLRMVSGVDSEEFQKKHGGLEADILQELAILEEQGLLIHREGVYTLTKKGILFYDTVAAELI